jgi:hypothetical protein
MLPRAETGSAAEPDPLFCTEPIDVLFNLHSLFHHEKHVSEAVSETVSDTPEETLAVVSALRDACVSPADTSDRFAAALRFTRRQRNMGCAAARPKTAERLDV